MVSKKRLKNSEIPHLVVFTYDEWKTNSKDALNKIPNSKRNLIVIFGSLYLVGYVLSIN